MGEEGPAEYIERITYAIWNGPDRDPELCHRYYEPGTRIRTDAGDIVGAAAVTANTRARLAAFPDFHGVIDDTIWCTDGAGGYRTSMRWTWTGTHLGPHPLAEPTGRQVRYGAIADCVVRDGVIVDEWLAGNPLALARQLGVSDDEALRRCPSPPQDQDTSGPPVEPRGAGAVVAAALVDGMAGRPASDTHDPETIVEIGPDRTLRGPAAVDGWLAGWRRLLRDPSVRLDDQIVQPGASGDARVATRATVIGTAAAEASVRVLLIAHHRVRGDRITAGWVQYDELALLCRAGGVP